MTLESLTEQTEADSQVLHIHNPELIDRLAAAATEHPLSGHENDLIAEAMQQKQDQADDFTSFYHFLPADRERLVMLARHLLGETLEISSGRA